MRLEDSVNKVMTGQEALDIWHSVLNHSDLTLRPPGFLFTLHTLFNYSLIHKSCVCSPSLFKQLYQMNGNEMHGKENVILCTVISILVLDEPLEYKILFW